MTAAPPAAWPARIDGVLLDVDGTLVDSNWAHARAWQQAFRETGQREAGVEELRRMIGMGGDKLLPQALGIEGDSPLASDLSERRAEAFRRDGIPSLRPTPGARELIERLRASGLRVALATSGLPDEVRSILEVTGLPGDLAEHATSSDDVEGSKPDPDIVEVALAEIGLAPENVVLIGDTPYDIEAARRAGVAVIAVRSGGWDGQDLDGAVAVFDDPADLLAHLDETPLGRRGTGAGDAG